MAFLQRERQRPLAHEPKESPRRLSSESVYLEIAALRAFYRFAENEKLLPLNVAEHLSLPRRWKRLPNRLTNAEIETSSCTRAAGDPAHLCDQAILELAYASGLRRVGVVRPAAGTTASRSRLHQRHRQGQQGTGRARWAARRSRR